MIIAALLLIPLGIYALTQTWRSRTYGQPSDGEAFALVILVAGIACLFMSL